MYDIWFLSHKAKSNAYLRFKEQFPYARLKICNKSFPAILKECAEQSFTKMFYTVSDVCQLPDGFDFSFECEVYEIGRAHV